jgi:hypothetical protein
MCVYIYMYVYTYVCIYIWKCHKVAILNKKNYHFFSFRNLENRKEENSKEEFVLLG